jgi:hypothetical protein
VPTRVLFTGRANQQVLALPGRPRRRVADFIEQLQSQGCAALGYRLSGPKPISHICVKHIGFLRAVVAFQSPELAWVLLVAPHDNSDPGIDVYIELYRLVGHEPSGSEGRNKPACCDDSADPPDLSEMIDALASRARMIRRTRR